MLGRPLTLGITLLLALSCGRARDRPPSLQEVHTTRMKMEDSLVGPRVNRITPASRQLNARVLVVIPSHKMHSDVLRKTFIKTGVGLARVEEMIGPPRKTFEVGFYCSVEALRRRQIFDEVMVETSDDPESVETPGYDITMYPTSPTSDHWSLRRSPDDEAEIIEIDPSVAKPLAEKVRRLYLEVFQDQMRERFGSRIAAHLVSNLSGETTAENYSSDLRVSCWGCIVDLRAESQNHEVNRWESQLNRMDELMTEADLAWLDAVERVATKHPGK
jgi:hypothetical protein